MKVPGQVRPSVGVQPQAVRGSRSRARAAVTDIAGAGIAGVDLGAPLDFRTIYDSWFDDVSRWIRALGGPDADREDIVQEVFLVVRRRLGAFDGANLPAWLYRITRRQVRDFRRRTWVKHIFSKRRVAEPDVLPHGEASPAMAFERKERQRILHQLLLKMKEERRTTFVLFEIEGLSGEEIARIQSVPVNTVWTRLHHARKEFFALAARYQLAQGRGR
jgi:RNA polymerase sigma-70 factor, ECF subfamily